MLQFSAQAGATSPLAARKSHPDALFTEAVEVPGDAFAGTPAATSAGGSAELAEMRGFFASIRKFFDLGAAAEDAPSSPSKRRKGSAKAAAAAEDASMETSPAKQAAEAPAKPPTSARTSKRTSRRRGGD